MNKNEFIQDVAILAENIFLCSQEVANYIASQIALESNFGQSRLSKLYNNETGMKFPKVRPTTAIYETEKQFAAYNKKADSILDLFIWCIWNKIKKEELHKIELYKTFIQKHGYCTDLDYTTRIDTIYNQYFTN